MKILAIDTATRVIRIALLSGNKFFSVEKDLKFGEYEGVLLLIKSLLGKAKVKIEDIDYFGVCNGPGSFTGMRIGLSVVKALAYSFKKPIIAYKSLDLLAWSLKDDFSDLLCVMQDARRGNVYSAVYVNSRNFRRISSYALTDVKQMLNRLSKISKQHKIYFCGDATLDYKDNIEKVFPESSIIGNKGYRLTSKAMIYWIKNNIGSRVSSFDVSPFYMYPKDCQVRKPVE
ncbi:MAG: tRNA (adenosine(37)-N6)-threonylcarbamoyltransferase complex dimerization subunit type 1 TsaB [Candidatus Omnitrophica bacterium]|nr:tRNA (adenosine(37)-N6)-threonylcarbamoyltransferase complex dimerization subunit type 1 TsaB [Candidatus Omnitrophota bacterium]